MGDRAASDRTLAAAEEVVDTLDRLGVSAVLIGALALAAHGYPRSTEDVDLAIGVHPDRLDPLAATLRAAGYQTDLSTPDAGDPLGGVLRLRRAGIDPIEVVNFVNPPAGGFPALALAAVRDAEPYREGSPLRVVSLTHLVLFKLYAGGVKSKHDTLELLRRHPEVDLDALRAACARYRLDRRLTTWLREIEGPADEEA